MFAGKANTNDEQGTYDREKLWEVPAKGKKEIEGKLRRKYVESTIVEKDGPYVIRNGLAITIDEMAQSVHASVQRSLVANFASG